MASSVPRPVQGMHSILFWHPLQRVSAVPRDGGPSHKRWGTVVGGKVVGEPCGRADRCRSRNGTEQMAPPEHGRQQLSDPTFLTGPPWKPATRTQITGTYGCFCPFRVCA